jgi:DNA invertase Pin-like site-specific DNA recombinase
MEKAIVGYLRVSTSEQGKSGLGLEAQREAIQSFAKAERLTVAQWFTEVETGKGFDAMDRRPVLVEALKTARKLKAPLVVSKLDRLARDLAFTARLMAEGVQFVALDAGKDAQPFVLHIRAAMDEEERRKISQRTKDGLAAYKRRGGKLGNPNKKALALAQRRGAQTNKEAADAFARSILPHIRGCQHRGMSLREIAKEFNRTGIRTARGGEWSVTQLSMIQRRLA